MEFVGRVRAIAGRKERAQEHSDDVLSLESARAQTARALR
ncbi:hypothetical protein AKJ09_09615 [Labilithrix luteola]|uniref:Uncharacterized protein n=1 Tax=Labilithrix luteola TaxID=1391654 RepID=A0A0K1QBA5_9BACT|nr:hypothetical protein AKJ09_09615 [Labilithrix luteola]